MRAVIAAIMKSTAASNVVDSNQRVNQLSTPISHFDGIAVRSLL